MGLAGTIDSSQCTGGSTISLPITFNPGAGTVTVDSPTGALLMTGVVAASSGVTKLGSGTLSLEADDGSLAATLDAGTLLVDGTIGVVAANTGTTIGGSGTVDGITTISGTVSPGDSATVDRHPDRHRQPGARLQLDVRREVERHDGRLGL